MADFIEPHEDGAFVLAPVAQARPVSEPVKREKSKKQNAAPFLDAMSQK
ncbi:MAG: hypothetical protein ACK53U_09010 [Alphaproteobacteria bacterium]